MEREYLPEELQTVPYYGDVRLLACSLALEGNWAEFGVRTGNSARELLSHLPRDGKLHLFDSFKGLPEDWDHGKDWTTGTRVIPAGRSACKRPKFDDARVIVYEGWFEDTLPCTGLGPLDLVHIDCDLYSSTKTVLSNIDVHPGTVMLFDEYHGYPTYGLHEKRALDEFLFVTKYKIDWYGIGRFQACGIIR